jgi:hypothetical protein
MRAAVRKNESSRFAFFLTAKAANQKRGKKDGMEKRTHKRLVSVFHVRSISLFAA